MIYLAAACMAAALAASPKPAIVNLPYPDDPAVATAAFMHLFQQASPKPWHPGASPPHSWLVAGTLRAKGRCDSGTILLVTTTDGHRVILYSPSPLPDIAAGQQIYAIAAFSPDRPGALILRGILLASDLGTQRESYERIMGLASEPQEPQQAPSPQPESSPKLAEATAKPGQSLSTAPAAATSRPDLAPAVVGAAGHRTTQATGRSPVWPSTSPQEDFSREQVEWWKRWIAKHNSRLTDAEREAIVRWVLYYSQCYAVDHRLIFAVMRYESNFDPGCISHAGAIGLMQLMPQTARQLGVNPWIVEENIKGGIMELAQYLDMYAGRSNYEQTALALACYNAGPNRVKQAGGIPDIPETRNYVRRVTELFAKLVAQGAP